MDCRNVTCDIVFWWHCAPLQTTCGGLQEFYFWYIVLWWHCAPLQATCSCVLLEFYLWQCFNLIVHHYKLPDYAPLQTSCSGWCTSGILLVFWCHHYKLPVVVSLLRGARVWLAHEIVRTFTQTACTWVWLDHQDIPSVVELWATSKLSVCHD